MAFVLNIGALHAFYHPRHACLGTVADARGNAGINLPLLLLCDPPAATPLEDQTLTKMEYHEADVTLQNCPDCKEEGGLLRSNSDPARD